VSATNHDRYFRVGHRAEVGQGYLIVSTVVCCLLYSIWYLGSAVAAAAVAVAP